MVWATSDGAGAGSSLPGEVTVVSFGFLSLDWEKHLRAMYNAEPLCSEPKQVGCLEQEVFPSLFAGMQYCKFARWKKILPISELLTVQLQHS